MSDDLLNVLDDAADAIRSKLPPHTYTGGKNCPSSPKCERCRRLKIIDRLEAERWKIGYVEREGAVT